MKLFKWPAELQISDTSPGFLTSDYMKHECLFIIMVSFSLWCLFPSMSWVAQVSPHFLPPREWRAVQRHVKGQICVLRSICGKPFPPCSRCDSRDKQHFRANELPLHSFIKSKPIDCLSTKAWASFASPSTVRTSTMIPHRCFLH